MSEPIEQPAEGLWSGLRRRKVVQWGIAYVAAAPGGGRKRFHVRLSSEQSAHAAKLDA
ncbi:MAG: hypothetical protein V9E93_13330 [Steroidobacteraceae bacterium]|nr:hypothetical protein [Steroidobacteraceae bacterium]MBP7014984.1 hypothetical protein [Steroidobacteraceae bacterium]